MNISTIAVLDLKGAKEQESGHQAHLRHGCDSKQHGGSLC